MIRYELEEIWKGGKLVGSQFLFSSRYVSASFGGILQASLSINGMLGGPPFALFLLAYFNPWSESIGLVSGYISGSVTFPVSIPQTGFLRISKTISSIIGSKSRLPVWIIPEITVRNLVKNSGKNCNRS